MKRILHYFCLLAAFAGILTGAGSCVDTSRQHRGDNYDPEYPDDPTRPGEGTEESRDITLKVGYGEYWGQWYNDKSDSYLIYLYDGATDSEGNFTASAHMLTLDILLPKTGNLSIKEGVYTCTDAAGQTQIFIPAYDSTDENGNAYLDGSTLYVQKDSKHSSLYGITDGQLVVRKTVTNLYEIEARIVANGAEYNFYFKGAINIEDKTQGGDDSIPGQDTYSLKAKALYNGEVYDGSDDYTLYLYYGEYLDNGDFKTVGTEMVFEILTDKTGGMTLTPGTYKCTGSEFKPGYFLEGLEEDGTVYPSYLYRQYDNKGTFKLDLVTGGELSISRNGSEYQVRASFSTPSGSFLSVYEGPVTIIDNRQAEVPKDVEMKDITRVVAMDCGQVWEGIECTDYRDWILYFYDKDAASSNEYTCVEILTQEKVKGSLPDMTLSKVVQVGNPQDFVPGVIIGGYTDEDSVAWGTWYCKGGTAYYAATKGSLDVKRSGSNYSFTFDFVDEDETYGGTFKGSYTGPVEFKVDSGASGAAKRSAGKGFSPRRGAAAAGAAAGHGRRAVGAGRKASGTEAAPAPALRRSRTLPKAS
jgi:hypothetical protein